MLLGAGHSVRTNWDSFLFLILLSLVTAFILISRYPYYYTRLALMYQYLRFWIIFLSSHTRIAVLGTVLSEFITWLIPRLCSSKSGYRHYRSDPSSRNKLVRLLQFRPILFFARSKSREKLGEEEKNSNGLRVGSWNSKFSDASNAACRAQGGCV